MTHFHHTVSLDKIIDNLATDLRNILDVCYDIYKIIEEKDKGLLDTMWLDPQITTNHQKDIGTIANELAVFFIQRYYYNSFTQGDGTAERIAQETFTYRWEEWRDAYLKMLFRHGIDRFNAPTLEAYMAYRGCDEEVANSILQSHFKQGKTVSSAIDELFTIDRY
jgi:hypothetical protein